MKRATAALAGTLLASLLTFGCGGVDCPHGYRLIDGQCIEGCVSSDECADPTPLCNTDDNTCVQCLNESQCSLAAPVCDDGVCVECLDDSACSGTLAACERDRRTCVQCTGNSHCIDFLDGLAPICDTSSNRCVQCLGDGACGVSVPFCAVGACVECRTNDDCPSERPTCQEPGECVF